MPKRFLWIFGDNLLDDAVPKLKEMEQDENNKLYMHENYAVKTFEEGYGKYAQNNPYIKICDNLVEAIKRYPLWLPYMIVLMIGNSYVHDETFVEFHLKEMIQNLLKRVLDIIQKRKQQIPKWSFNEREPIVCVMRLLPKPAYALRNVEKNKHYRRKANAIIEEVTTKLNLKFINADEITCNTKGLFNERGHLLPFGFERMWVSISDAVRRHDKLESDYISLMNKKFRTIEVQTSSLSQPKNENGHSQYYNNQYYQNQQQPKHGYSDKYHYYNY